MNKFKNHFENVGQQIFLISYTIGLLFLVFYLRDIFVFLGQVLYFLSPLFTGIAVAYVLNPLMVKIEKSVTKKVEVKGAVYRYRRVISIFLTLLVVLAIVVAVSIFVLPELFNSLSLLFSNLGFYVENLVAFIRQIAIRMGANADDLATLNVERIFMGFGLDYRSIVSSASEWLVGTGSGVLVNLLSAGSSFFNFLMSTMIGLYFLAAKEELLKQMKMVLYAFMSEKHADIILENAHEANDIFKGFITTRIADIAILWIMMYLLLSLFRFPYTLLLSTISAIFTIIPVFGSLLADAVSVILLLALNPLYALGYYVIHQVVLNIDTNLIYPRFAGKSIGLPAVWILLSVLVAGYIGGPIYMLLAVPVTACVYAIFTRYVKRILREKGLEKITIDKQEEKGS